MFKAVIFDWDGTLADTSSVLLISFKTALREINCEVTDNMIERRIGIGTISTLQELLTEKQVPYDDELIQRLLKIKVQTEINHSNQVDLFEGAIELLNSLQGKIKIALASMNQREFIDHMLKEKKIQKFFDVTLTANEVSKPKPDPEIFLKTALKLNVKPEKCVVIEDSIFGVRAAKAANMGCIAVTQGAYSKEELCEEKPDLIVSSLKEKEVILRLIFS
jgi:HAD superfamily hydrolase (TIGR01509 family)